MQVNRNIPEQDRNPKAVWIVGIALGVLVLLPVLGPVLLWLGSFAFSLWLLFLGLQVGIGILAIAAAALSSLLSRDGR